MKKIYILLLAGLMSAMSVSAQHKEYKGEIVIAPQQLEQVKDSLLVRIDFDFSNVKVKGRRSISVIPTIIAPDKWQKLPEVMVKGRVDYLTSKRELALMSKSERSNYDPPYTIVKGYGDGQKYVSYRKALAFEPWMKDARLDVQEDLCGCGITPRFIAVAQIVDKVQLEKPVEPYVVTPYLAYVRPAAEAVKKREMIGEAFIDFVVAKTDIRPDYMNNPAELKKIADMMQEVRQDATITVGGISVIGYASPEGTLRFNKYLSEARAKALVDYLAPRFDYPKEMYSVAFGGENWEGLLARVEASDMKYRGEVIHILETVPAEINYQTNTSRKKSLMSLRGGEPYRFMLKEYFPALRKAICKIDYVVRGFDVAEAKEIIKTQPEKLSLAEMYEVAETYEAGSTEFTEVFETAVKHFPHDETANLNAASAALSRNDTVAAERYLGNVKWSSPEYNNALGVFHMLKENYEEAEFYLKKAADNGSESAVKNLGELRRKLDNIKLINK